MAQNHPKLVEICWIELKNGQKIVLKDVPNNLQFGQNGPKHFQTDTDSAHK